MSIVNQQHRGAKHNVTLNLNEIEFDAAEEISIDTRCHCCAQQPVPTRQHFCVHPQLHKVVKGVGREKALKQPPTKTIPISADRTFIKSADDQSLDRHHQKEMREAVHERHYPRDGEQVRIENSLHSLECVALLAARYETPSPSSASVLVQLRCVSFSTKMHRKGRWTVQMFGHDHYFDKKCPKALQCKKYWDIGKALNNHQQRCPQEELQKIQPP
mmetsp:Transcript_136766/g.262893  ORF Transcript_136766/g.262893 Transcript_136766/m.262893 type:complete len:216 (-) Transcript_136766:126-773(-)